MRSKPIALMLVVAFVSWFAAIAFAVAGQNSTSVSLCIVALILSVAAVTMDLFRG